MFLFFVVDAVDDDDGVVVFVVVLSKKPSIKSLVKIGSLTLANAGGGNHHPSSENCVFSTTVHPVDLRPVCKLEFVRCGPVEKNQSALSVSV